MTIQNRVQPGVPSGGQWAAQTRQEADTTLAAEPDWGTTSIREGSRSPWGTVDNVDLVAPGITFASTPGHGGLKLSKERNRAIPAPLRNSDGWYEEDCDFQIVVMSFPDAFPQLNPEEAERSVKTWSPDRWEKATGRTLAPGESMIKDRAVWTAAHATDFVTTSARNDADDPGSVLVTAKQRSTGEQRRFRVPKAEYEGRHQGELGQEGRFLIDLDRHEDITPPPVPVEPLPRYTGINEAGLTSVQRAALEKDLNKRWRHSDGRVSTLREVIGAGLTGKDVYLDGDRREYVLKVVDDTNPSAAVVYKVSKTTWGQVDAPDGRSPRGRLAQEREYQTAQLEKVTRYPRLTRLQAEKTRKLRQKIRQLTEAIEDLDVDRL